MPGSMRRGLNERRRQDDAGNAALEFLSLGVLLLVPIVYLVLTIGRVQAASMAADGAAVLGARAFSTAPTEPDGRRAAAAALELGLRDHGFGAGTPGSWDVRCAATPCLTPGARIEVAISVRVGLPLVPAFVSGALPAAVTVRAEQAAVVEEFRAVGAAG